MPSPLSHRSAFVVRSEIRNMSLECERVGGINLSQGICDTPTPESVRRSAQAAIEEGWNTYTPHTGVAELRHAIAGKLERFSNLTVDPDTEIVVSGGSTGAFYSACMALLNPGDEVILFEPFYGYHLSTLTATGLNAKFVRLHPPNWTFRIEDLARACGPRTRAIMICTPANPSGKVFTLAELEAIRDLAMERDLIVFTDEIYEHFLYDGRRHICPATIPGLRERTVVISGFSKLLSITGWRMGFAVAPALWAEAIGYFSDLIYVCAPAPLQVGVARGLAQLEPEYYEHLALAYRSKRDKICEVLDRAGLEPYIPAGGYYVLANIASLPGSSAKERVMFLLEKAGVACVPGDAFFHDDGGRDLARFCFAKSDAVLDQACRRLESFAGPSKIATTPRDLTPQLVK
jgi:aminotransferase